ncbi:hypothetical protein KR100_13125 [Synechococcus sp. KORDI-100]|uniref:hypothetical protein n=1 Tax=Synechococcus sp. KORDI-100 TaxID=1280380 RepID=UPI0004E05CA6|nr:hypothetical protein [Synechococcus sp. KORDI-100]AII44292.1 hypothetical protein KR100_13125 [Synechococcus sp. KORDI-100]
MASSTIRRLVLTLATGYLTIFGARQIPYQFENEWLVILPALIVVYSLTVWFEGLIFKVDAPEPRLKSDQARKKPVLKSRGFGSD